jgi:hypothetical protein
MATCNICGAATQLHSNGVPICLACLESVEAKPLPTPNEVQLGLPHE